MRSGHEACEATKSFRSPHHPSPATLLPRGMRCIITLDGALLERTLAFANFSCQRSSDEGRVQDAPNRPPRPSRPAARYLPLQTGLPPSESRCPCRAPNAAQDPTIALLRSRCTASSSGVGCKSRRRGLLPARLGCPACSARGCRARSASGSRSHRGPCDLRSELWNCFSVTSSVTR